MKKDVEIKKEQIEYLKKYLKNKKLEDAIDEVKSGRSIQYVVGDVFFYNSVIKVNESVLIPRFETELLVDKLIKYIKKRYSLDNKIKILDMCTGSGCIAISLKKEINCDMDAVDISNDALSVAKNNALINDVNINYIESDIFSNVCNKYNVIVSNPPYISYDENIMEEVRNNEPSLALYADDNGLYFYKKIIKNVKKYLKDDFIIAFEIGMNQADAIVNFISDNLSDVDVVVEKDYSDRDRFIFVFSKK